LDKAVHPSAQFSVGKVVALESMPSMQTLHPAMLSQVLLFNKDLECRSYVWQHIMPLCSGWFTHRVDVMVQTQFACIDLDAYADLLGELH
jgi:hypothetical protein